MEDGHREIKEDGSKKRQCPYWVFVRGRELGEVDLGVRWKWMCSLTQGIEGK